MLSLPFSARNYALFFQKIKNISALF